MLTLPNLIKIAPCIAQTTDINFKKAVLFSEPQ